MSASYVQNPVPWVAAYPELSKVRPDVADVLNAFYTSQPETDRADLTIAVADYPYADNIVDDGRPFWPGNKAIPPEYLIDGRLPFGIILNNYCEVSDFIFIHDKLEQVSQALLYPGGGVGLFELADYLTNVPNPQEPNWHITAGATSTYVVPNLTTKQNRKVMKEQFGADVDSLKLKEATTFADQMMGVAAFETIRKAWRLRMLYFSASWFERIRNSDALGSRARDVLVSRAWKTYSRIRTQKSNRLREALSDVATGGNQFHLAQAAVTLLSSLDDIFVGRRTCFVPVFEDTVAGPFGAISSQLVSKMMDEPPWILIPTYLSEQTPVGFVKLEHVTPNLQNGGATQGGARDKIVEIARMLRAAAYRRSGSDDDCDLQSYVDLLHHLVFQSPPTSQGSTIYDIVIDPQLVQARVRELTPNDFYSNLFTKIPRERCAFFRSSIRIGAKVI